ncbi:MAG: hypothetical protein AB2A00_16295 [Myxococcota bacterium]
MDKAAQKSSPPLAVSLAAERALTALGADCRSTNETVLFRIGLSRAVIQSVLTGELVDSAAGYAVGEHLIKLHDPPELSHIPLISINGCTSVDVLFSRIRAAHDMLRSRLINQREGMERLGLRPQMLRGRPVLRGLGRVGEYDFELRVEPGGQLTLLAAGMGGVLTNIPPRLRPGLSISTASPAEHRAQLDAQVLRFCSTHRGILVTRAAESPSPAPVPTVRFGLLGATPAPTFTAPPTTPAPVSAPAPLDLPEIPPLVRGTLDPVTTGMPPPPPTTYLPEVTPVRAPMPRATPVVQDPTPVTPPPPRVSGEKTPPPRVTTSEASSPARPPVVQDPTPVTPPPPATPRVQDPTPVVPDPKPVPVVDDAAAFDHLPTLPLAQSARHLRPEITHPSPRAPEITQPRHRPTKHKVDHHEATLDGLDQPNVVPQPEISAVTHPYTVLVLAADVKKVRQAFQSLEGDAFVHAVVAMDEGALALVRMARPKVLLVDDQLQMDEVTLGELAAEVHAGGGVVMGYVEKGRTATLPVLHNLVAPVTEARLKRVLKAAKRAGNRRRGTSVS